MKDLVGLALGHKHGHELLVLLKFRVNLFNIALQFHYLEMVLLAFFLMASFQFIYEFGAVDSTRLIMKRRTASTEDIVLLKSALCRCTVLNLISKWSLE